MATFCYGLASSLFICLHSGCYECVVVVGLLRTDSFTLDVNEFLCLILRTATASQIYSFLLLLSDTNGADTRYLV